jgi:hypothetical protein
MFLLVVCHGQLVHKKDFIVNKLFEENSENVTAIGDRKY